MGTRLEAETPLAVEAGEERVAALERSQQLRFPRVHEHPWAAAVEQTVLVGKGLDESGLEPAGHGRRALPPRLAEQVVEHLIDRRRLRRDLQDLGDPASSVVIE